MPIQPRRQHAEPFRSTRDEETRIVDDDGLDTAMGVDDVIGKKADHDQVGLVPQADALEDDALDLREVARQGQVDDLYAPCRRGPLVEHRLEAARVGFVERNSDAEAEAVAEHHDAEYPGGFENSCSLSRKP